MTKRAFGALFLCAVLGALAVRVARLDLRPMHHDEANQAVKFGGLLERGEYRFDPLDHHGPTLYYLTLPAAWAAGATTLTGLDERILRLVPALFGTALLVAFLLFSGGLAREARLAAAALAAVSPALSYYSRFYIQETLLVLFLAVLLGAGWRYAKRPSALWALAAGTAAGLMAATKETSLVLFGGLAAAFGVLSLIESIRTRLRGVTRAGDAWVWRDTRTKLPTGLHALLFLAAAAAVVIVFYSSFFHNIEGLADAARAVGTSFGRAGHPGVHAHPWPYYVRLLAWAKTAAGPVWSEGFLLVLALAGGLAAFGPDQGHGGSPRFLRFVFFFTVVTAAVFSLIPYKTPWNMLPFYLGLVILAGHGAAFLLKLTLPRPVKVLVAIVLAAGFAGLAVQNVRANFVRPADPANPYVYAQTNPDFLKLVSEVEKAAAASPEGRDLLIEVIAPPEETWPLPWSLRRFGRVGYWTTPDSAHRALPPGQAPVVISSAAFAGEVAEALGEDYVQTFYGLRPEVVLALFVRRDRGEAMAPERTLGCTAFLLRNGREVVAGKNLDWPLGDGAVHLNPRGATKAAFLANPGRPLHWASRYGSVTFNQLGRDLPLGGMNEQGLVIEELSYSPSRYPDRDERPAVNEFQWIQFHLDTCASVREVLNGAAGIRVERLFAGVHYFLCDRSGDHAIVEFLDGRTVCTPARELPAPVLSNNSLPESRKNLALFQGFGGDRDLPSGPDSISRYVRAAGLVKGYGKAGDGPPAEYAAGVLRRLAQPDTQWSIVYDLARLAIRVRTAPRPGFRTIRFDGVDFDRPAGGSSFDLGRPDRAVRFEPTDAGREGAFVGTVLLKMVECGAITPARRSTLAAELREYREGRGREGAGPGR
ncbi:MAG TPA: TIGR03663 family protein [Candidatus Aminicenantes bacterium]|nr:TIGR03663 family protein [Candidatus Aminicenantes bacterium]